MRRNLLSKFKGVILAGSLGDAIGELAFRFRSKERLINAIDESEKLIYTDDTAMAVALCEYLLKIKKKEINPEELGKKFLQAYEKEPWRGYGPGPPKIFSLVKKGCSFQEAASSVYPGGSFGNGSAMRVHPAALYFYDEDDSVFYEKIKLTSLPTHIHPLAIEGAVILAKAISFLLENKEFEFREFFEKLIKIAKREEFKEKLAQTEKLLVEDRSFSQAKRILKNNSTSLGSVPFSLFCFLKNKDNFSEGLIETVLIPGDRDTVGCMSACLWGAYLGVEAIPEDWLCKLEKRNYLCKLAEDLYTKKMDEREDKDK